MARYQCGADQAAGYLEAEYEAEELALNEAKERRIKAKKDAMECPRVPGGVLRFEPREGGYEGDLEAMLNGFKYTIVRRNGVADMWVDDLGEEELCLRSVASANDYNGSVPNLMRIAELYHSILTADRNGGGS